MGIFKQMKEMKATVATAPDAIDQANQRAERSQQPSVVPAEGPDYEPIAGVTLELYAAISKGLADYDFDLSRATDVAASKGVVEADWSTAVQGWNARIRANPNVGQRFNALYAVA
jgi:hypothetical protein